MALEQGGSDPEQLAAMMRAAHSMKGAARVVNVQPAVEISHVMEDCFVRAQKAEMTLTPGIIDVLLGGVDMLQEIAKAAGGGFAAWFEGAAARSPTLCSASRNLLGKVTWKHRKPRRFARRKQLRRMPSRRRRPVLHRPQRRRLIWRPSRVSSRRHPLPHKRSRPRRLRRQNPRRPRPARAWSA